MLCYYYKIWHFYYIFWHLSYSDWWIFCSCGAYVLSLFVQKTVRQMLDNIVKFPIPNECGKVTCGIESTTKFNYF